ncbi:MAG TPA: nicotinamide-nucleotide amidohydrolase family protein, partial [Flavisolibacter sp.]|nr:nicotinamide-nucleotide amidohydrolase family protein [Flavisolibacter sp.]
VVDEGALKNVTEIFKKLGRPMIERNAKQAEVPESCVVLPNLRGTAPGMWFEAPPPPRGGLANSQPLPKQHASDQTTSPQSEVSALDTPPLGGGGAVRVVYASLPGVPHEMKGLIINSVIPKIKESFSLPAVVHRTLLTAGQGESFLADKLVNFEAALPAFIKLAYLPAYGMVRLRLTGRGTDTEQVEAVVVKTFEDLKAIVQEWMVADEDISLPEAVSQLLKEKKKTVATAESCTGGYIAHLFTSLPGSSTIFNGSVVSYANEVKQTVLNVSAETLKQYGAVSEQTVLQMATAACALLKTDYAIATSGIMGPDGGSEEKPVGTVWMAVAAKDGRT